MQSCAGVPGVPGEGKLEPTELPVGTGSLCCLIQDDLQLGKGVQRAPGAIPTRSTDSHAAAGSWKRGRFCQP